MPKCRLTGADFAVSVANRDLLDRIAPVISGKRYPIPDPTCCPKIRLQRRLAFRNQIHVFHRLSSSTGKTIFSMYPAKTRFPVMEKDEWYGDSWDPRQYGRDYDFSRPFFEQFFALEHVIPHPSLATINILDNSEYINNASSLKNCYFVFNNDYLQDCMYCESCDHAADCVDCSRSPKCELCYDCADCQRCYNIQSSSSCDDCRDSFFLLNCRSCEHCFGCVNLRRARYCFFNQQVSQQEYTRRIGAMNLSSFVARESWRQKAGEFARRQPRPHITASFVENVSGNYLLECRNVFESYAVLDGQDLHHCSLIAPGARDSLDLSVFCGETQLSYECLCCGYGAQNLRFCNDCWSGVTDLDYCVLCSGAANLFGCFGLRKREYCILNKQYNRSQYFELLPRIIAHMTATGEWGEFFPTSYSPIPYNYSLAQRYFRVGAEEAATNGFNWQQREERQTDAAMRAEDLPDALPESDEPIDVIGLGNSRCFRITSREIQLFRRFQAPLPRVSYDQRMDERQYRLGGIFLQPARCAKSGATLMTTLSPADWIIWDKELFDREYNA